jgi:polygalacturonase
LTTSVVITSVFTTSFLITSFSHRSGRDADAWKIGLPSKRVTVRNIVCASTSNGFCIGSEMSGGVEDVTVENFTCTSCGNGIEFKANKDRGAYIKNVSIDRMYAEKCKGSFVEWTNDYHSPRGGDFPTLFSDFKITNARCKETGTGINAGGLSEKHIQEATFTNVVIDKATKSLDIKNVDGFVFNGVVINGKTQKSPGNSTVAGDAQTYICLEGACVACAQPTVGVNKTACEQLCLQELNMVCLGGQCVPYHLGVPRATCEAGCGPAAARAAPAVAA